MRNGFTEQVALPSVNSRFVMNRSSVFRITRQRQFQDPGRLSPLEATVRDATTTRSTLLGRVQGFSAKFPNSINTIAKHTNSIPISPSNALGRLLLSNAIANAIGNHRYSSAKARPWDRYHLAASVVTSASFGSEGNLPRLSHRHTRN